MGEHSGEAYPAERHFAWCPNDPAVMPRGRGPEGASLRPGRLAAPQAYRARAPYPSPRTPRAQGRRRNPDLSQSRAQTRATEGTATRSLLASAGLCVFAKPLEADDVRLTPARCPGRLLSGSEHTHRVRLGSRRHPSGLRRETCAPEPVRRAAREHAPWALLRLRQPKLALAGQSAVADGSRVASPSACAVRRLSRRQAKPSVPARSRPAASTADRLPLGAPGTRSRVPSPRRVVPDSCATRRRVFAAKRKSLCPTNKRLRRLHTLTSPHEGTCALGSCAWGPDLIASSSDSTIRTPRCQVQYPPAAPPQRGFGLCGSAVDLRCAERPTGVGRGLRAMYRQKRGS